MQRTSSWVPSPLSLPLVLLTHPLSEHLRVYSALLEILHQVPLPCSLSALRLTLLLKWFEASLRLLYANAVSELRKHFEFRIASKASVEYGTLFLPLQ